MQHHNLDELDKDYQVLQSTQTDMTCALAYFMIALLFEHELGVIILCLLPSLKSFIATVLVSIHLFMACLS